MLTKKFLKIFSFFLNKIMLEQDSVRNLQYDSDIRVAQPTRIEPISKKYVFFSYKRDLILYIVLSQLSQCCSSQEELKMSLKILNTKIEKLKTTPSCSISHIFIQRNYTYHSHNLVYVKAGATGIQKKTQCNVYNKLIINHLQ